MYEAELNAGILLLRQKNPADALPLLAHAAEQKPDEFRPRFYLAEAQLQSGAPDAAEASYRRALELDPKSAACELGLGRALARQEKLAEAAPHYRRAAELDPKYANLCWNSPRFTRRTGNPKRRSRSTGSSRTTPRRSGRWRS